MPEIKFKHIVSCSSEHLNHKVENLLKPETYYKWKCESGKEKNASVIIQLEQSSKISSVDIGNNGSAFIELLVGRSTWGPEEEYQVLIVASSFMSPSESKGGTNLHRVRLFGPENLNKSTLDQKWDRVKIVCSQPYNKDEGYGISFITLHSEAEPKKGDGPQDTTPVLKKIGCFKLKDEPSTDISIGSFFMKKGEPESSRPPVTQSLAAAARDANNSLKSSAKPKGNLKPEAIIGAKQMKSRSPPQIKRKSSKIVEPSTIKPDTSSTKGTVTNQKEKLTTTPDQPPKKRLKSDTASTEKKRRKKAKRQVPYHRILRGVIFALSGYQNPQRGIIRDKATSMGGEYRPDWGPGCTHLICAFRNTPKFNQVKGKGKIVTRKWIDDCDQDRQRAPLKRYRIDGGGSSSSYSESEDEDDFNRSEENNNGEGYAATATRPKNDSLMKHDQDEHKEGKGSNSDCDTMDELEKVRNLQAEDPYGGTTEEDDNVVPGDGSIVQETSSSPVGLPTLPNFFEDLRFLLYGEFEKEERRLLTRYIVAYNGKVEDYMSDNVNYVITNEDWDDNFEQAKAESHSLVFIRPIWIFKCHERGGLVDVNEFVVSPY